ncbi:hypothetical protein [Kordiimonas sp. SCSIO 12610]|uniref:hypothetical protein n=1 Tax=Kordiimonas sp. SCSIO 12610 TaxID=2829597 RepID=UPI002109D88D|nr:hypothetical protein [Kordiimonas sp. SCSIO 12610]UTW55659.1 hypothetical protein KFF44_01850 [Kordiimonas sp. SCSIO 12610]
MSTTAYSLNIDTTIDCPKPALKDDPFADLDDLLTADEKREALHEDLERELARHKAPCDPKKKNNKKSAQSEATKPTAQGQQGPNSSSQQQQASAQTNQNSANSTQQSSNAQQAVNTNQQNQAASQNSATSNSATSNSATSSATASTDTQSAATQQTGQQYSSPWAQKPSAAGSSGTVDLEPMAESTESLETSVAGNPATSTQSQSSAEAVASPGSGNAPQSLPASGVSGAEEKLEDSKKASAAGDSKFQSKFLQAYGSAGATEPETIEDIATRHKSQGQPGYGTPGNTGPNQQRPNYSDPGKNPSQATTVGADSAVVIALEKRLEAEKDPEKRKEIQAEIDKYKKSK